MLPCETTPGADGTFVPGLFNFAPGQVMCDMQWPLIEDPNSVARELLTISANWTISVLKSAAPVLSTRFATEATALSCEDLRAAEAKKMQKPQPRKLLT